MHLKILSCFLTLVLLVPELGFTAPTADIYPSTTLPDTSKNPKVIYPKQFLNTGYFRSSNNISLGAASGVFDVNRENESLGHLQFSRTQYNFDEGAQEFGLDLYSNGMLGWNANYRRSWLQQEWAEPYYKLGLQAIYHSGQGLGNFINYQRYFFRAAIGFDDLLSRRRRLRTEVFSSIGVLGTNFGISLTWAFPDEY